MSKLSPNVKFVLMYITFVCLLAAFAVTPFLRMPRAFFVACLALGFTFAYCAHHALYDKKRWGNSNYGAAAVAAVLAFAMLFFGYTFSFHPEVWDQTGPLPPDVSYPAAVKAALTLTVFFAAVHLGRKRWMIVIATAAIALCAAPAQAQVLTTAETLGTGKQVVLISENHLFVDNVDLNIVYVQYVRGLTSRVDAYLSLGTTRIFGDNQAWVGIGVNANILKWRGYGVSAFGVASIPLHKRDQASTVLLTPALIVSKSLHEGGVAVYSGVNSVIPIGARERGVFTPSTYKVNVPIGLVVPISDWAVFAEADIGRLKAVGLGIGRAF